MSARITRVSKSFALIALLILTAAAPLVDLAEESPTNNDVDVDSNKLKLGDRISTNAGSRAPCPAVQSDGGTTGDTGNTSSTAKSLGTDPTNGPNGVSGCIDSADPEDMYAITTTAGKEVDIELVVPAGADFDLYILDATMSTAYDLSEYNDPLEKVSTAGTSLEGNATTFYVWINAYSGDGQYTLRVWTNNSTPKPDLTVSNIIAPSTASAGSVVSINYDINNIGSAALTSSTPYDIVFILSLDTNYDSNDTIINTQISGPNLASGASQQMSTSVQIPLSVPAGNYYWIVWPDGYDNVTESDDLNNNDYSLFTTSISFEYTSRFS